MGGGKTIRDWENRFVLAYQKCKGENVTLVGGVAPTATRFARYLLRKHKVFREDLWQTQIVTLFLQMKIVFSGISRAQPGSCCFSYPVLVIHLLE